MNGRIKSKGFDVPLHGLGAFSQKYFRFNSIAQSLLVEIFPPHPVVFLQKQMLPLLALSRHKTPFPFQNQRSQAIYDLSINKSKTYNMKYRKIPFVRV